MLLNIIVWIIVGGIAGWLASLVVRGAGLGILGDIIVGIVGALIGGFVVSLLLPGTFGFTGFNLGSLIIAFIGAVILLLIVKLFTGGRRRTATY
ncbi:MAG: GlsB/YeaQ/YmgE family stress response membrane protein [Ktedonobacterales bacterium]